MEHYDKLVRDRIPELIEAKGKQCAVRGLDDEEYARRLDEKLNEELLEYQQSRDMTELIDLVEIAQAIVERQGGDWPEFERLRAAKREDHGGFSRRFLLMSVEDR